jgi:hypothetical protein
MKPNLFPVQALSSEVPEALVEDEEPTAKSRRSIRVTFSRRTRAALADTHTGEPAQRYNLPEALQARQRLAVLFSWVTPGVLIRRRRLGRLWFRDACVRLSASGLVRQAQ